MHLSLPLSPNTLNYFQSFYTMFVKTALFFLAMSVQILPAFCHGNFVAGQKGDCDKTYCCKGESTFRLLTWPIFGTSS